MLDAYCIDSITIIRSGGWDKWGEPEVTTNVTFRGRIERKTRLVRNFKGEEAISMAMVYVPGNMTVDHEDKLRFDGEDHAILSIGTMADFSKSHYEVYV